MQQLTHNIHKVNRKLRCPHCNKYDNHHYVGDELDEETGSYTGAIYQCLECGQEFIYKTQTFL